MFWYNRIAKLKRHNAPQETQDKANAALKQFQAEAVKQKRKVKSGKLTAREFEAWLLAQERVIEEIL